MMSTIFFLIMLAGVMLYPPAVLAINTIKGVGGYNPGFGEKLLCCLPIANLIVIRKQLYGSCKLVAIPSIVLLLAVIFRVASILMVMVAPSLITISSAVLICAIIVYWFCCSLVVADLANCLDESILIKILSFVVPPLAQYILSRDVIPLMRAAQADLEDKPLGA